MKKQTNNKPEEKYYPTRDPRNPLRHNDADLASKKENKIIFDQIRQGDFTNTGRLTNITDEIATLLLKKFKKSGDLDSNALNLDGLSTVPDSVLKILSSYKGFISLNRIRSLSPTAAEHLSQNKAGLSLYELIEIPEEIAKILAKSKHWIPLGSVAADNMISKFQK